ncbi:MAG: hypothetical protein IPP17_03525 [Bacteroidetes bacterium]|nr:hypothetical protein [Bacteroidota bacterium]
MSTMASVNKLETSFCSTANVRAANDVAVGNAPANAELRSFFTQPVEIPEISSVM